MKNSLRLCGGYFSAVDDRRSQCTVEIVSSSCVGGCSTVSMNGREGDDAKLSELRHHVKGWQCT